MFVRSETVEAVFSDKQKGTVEAYNSLAVQLHREVRETLNDLAKWSETMESLDKSQSVNVITVIQAHFAEKSPDEWRVLRNALAEAGVLEG